MRCSSFGGLAELFGALCQLDQLRRAQRISKPKYALSTQIDNSPPRKKSWLIVWRARPSQPILTSAGPLVRGVNAPGLSRIVIRSRLPYSTSLAAIIPLVTAQVNTYDHVCEGDRNKRRFPISGVHEVHTP
jgi:hypothetical protein